MVRRRKWARMLATEIALSVVFRSSKVAAEAPLPAAAREVDIPVAVAGDACGPDGGAIEMPNLSILDLIFCTGKRAVEFL